MTEAVARIRITLEDLEPPIWRRVDVPVSTNLRAFHEIVQAAMPWQNIHLFEYRVGEKVYGEPQDEDSVWGRKVYQARSLRLSMLIERGIRSFIYVYDFGDDWTHDITIEDIRQGDPSVDYPVFVAGERRAPPEDIGGPPGFMDFLEAMANRSHPEHREMARWYGGPFNPVDCGASDLARRVGEIAERRKQSLEAFRRSREMRRH